MIDTIGKGYTYNMVLILLSISFMDEVIRILPPDSNNMPPQVYFMDVGMKKE